MSPTLLLFVYCAVIVAGSLLGGWLPSLVRLTHTRMQLMMSFVGGLMLGVAVFHMLPHAVEHISLETAVLWMIAGLLLMFFLVRAFHFHQHGPLEPGARQTACDHEDAHEPHGAHGHAHETGPKHQLSWIGVAIGLSLHTAIDGVALAADVAASEGMSGAGDGAAVGLLGVGTFLAIVLHKPLDALSITSLMAAGGWTFRFRQLVNVGFALMCPIGAFLFYLGFAGQGVVVGCALAAAAGVFLCISLGDLLPEVQFHQHDRIKLSAVLLVGVALAYAIHFVEPHHHGHGTPAQDGQEQLHDHGHSH